MAKRGRPRKARSTHNPFTGGHNGGPQIDLTDEQTQALFYQHRDAYSAALKRKKDADTGLKNVCKAAISELGKPVIGDIKLAIELATPEGEAAVKERFEAQARVLRWLGLPFGTQGALFPDGEDLTPSVDRARAEGKRNGLAGEPCEPPHAPSVPQFNAWIDGWHEGQAVLVTTKMRPFPPDEDDGEDDSPEDSAQRRRRQYETDESVRD